MLPGLFLGLRGCAYRVKRPAPGLQFLRMFKHTRCFLTGPSVNSVKGAVNETSRIDGLCGRSRLLRSHRVVASRARIGYGEPRDNVPGI